MNYYNEWDPQAAAWLRELIENKLIPEGVVDERSITEVQAKDIKGFTQCHFFAGIGGWPLALQIAGVPGTTRLWTGSPPCQPFSAAGKQLGQYDPRHLAPVFLDLISQCRPPVLFGEQVAPAIGKSWMCDLQAHLEGEGYAVGFAVLPACGVGAPHKRDRLFFGAHSLAHGDDDRQQSGGRRGRGVETPKPGDYAGGCGTPDQLADAVREQRNRRGGVGEGRRVEPTDGSGVFQLGDSDGKGSQIRRGESGEQLNQEGRETAKRPGGLSGVSGRVAYSESQRREDGETKPGSGHSILGEAAEVLGAGNRSFANTTDPHNGLWGGADWLGCRDGKFRPVRSGSFPLANGIPSRVGRLRGYGNAIVPQVAAEFIKAFMAAKAEAGV